MEQHFKDKRTENPTLTPLEYLQLVDANAAFMEKFKFQLMCGLVTVETIAELLQFLNRTQRMIELGPASEIPQDIQEAAIKSQKLMYKNLVIALNMPAKVSVTYSSSPRTT